MVPSLVNMVDG
ncbi:unnamed protein product, partial [Rotaria magnacalcarata]